MPTLTELLNHLNECVENLKFCINEGEVPANTTACLGSIEITCDLLRRKLNRQIAA